MASDWLASKCFKTWSKLNCSLIKWDETNCSFRENNFVKTALKQKKYAFISDYYRLKALYENGGIYLDTDIIVQRSLPEWFFRQKCIFGFMFDNMVSTAFIMAEKHSPVIKKLIDRYDIEAVSLNVGNNELVTDFLISEYPNILLSGKRQCLADGIWIFPKEYFESPLLIKINGGGYAKHMFNASWIEGKSKNRFRKIMLRFRFYIPILDFCYQKFGRWISNRNNRFYKRYLQDIEIP